MLRNSYLLSCSCDPVHLGFSISMLHMRKLRYKVSCKATWVVDGKVRIGTQFAEPTPSWTGDSWLSWVTRSPHRSARMEVCRVAASGKENYEASFDAFLLFWIFQASLPRPHFYSYLFSGIFFWRYFLTNIIETSLCIFINSAKFLCPILFDGEEVFFFLLPGVCE